MIFSHVFYQFCSISGLHCNIWTWYKIPDYLWNCFFKKSLFQKQKKIFCFRAYDQILKFVQAYFYKKQKLHFFHVLKCKMNIVISLLLSVRVWPKYQKSFTIYFVHFIFKVLGFSCKF
jgi:hypothetical protein